MQLSHIEKLLDDKLDSDLEDVGRFSRVKREVYGFRPEDDIRQLLEDEPQHRAAVDTALAHWCIHQGALEPGSVVGYYCMRRVAIALQLVRSLAPLRLETAATQPEFLHWCLIDYWQLAGSAQWIHQTKSR